MKWFKHYSNASDSTSLNLIYDKLGVSGIAYYWLLIELLSEKFNGDETEFEVSLTQLSRKLRVKNVRTLNKVIQNFNETLEISIKVCGKVVFIDYPKLLQIKDNHTSRAKTTRKSLPSKFLLDKDKDKEKEKDKDNNIKKAKPSMVGQKDIFDLWNKVCGDKLSHAKVLNAVRKKKIRVTQNQVKELSELQSWEVYFGEILKSPFLTGANDRGWKANFDWAIREASYIKTMEGFYLFGNKVEKRDNALNQTLDLIQNNPYE